MNAVPTVFSESEISFAFHSHFSLRNHKKIFYSPNRKSIFLFHENIKKHFFIPYKILWQLDRYFT